MSRILVVAPNWIGDALMAQPLLARLREKDPAATIDVLAPDWVAPVLKRMPEVNDVIAAPLRHGALQWGERRRLATALRARSYEQAFVLPNSWKSALIPFFARIPRRTGYRGEMRYGLLNDARKTARVPMAEHYARLAGEGAVSKPRLRAAPEEIEAAKRRHGVGGRYIAICPGAEYGPAKRWPYFAALVPKLPLPAVLLGSPGDAQAAAGIPGTNLVGKTPLDDAVLLIAGADAVVSNDSGLMHVAAALGRPQVALYGSSSPEHTPPLSGAARVLWLHVECAPCYKRECPLGHFRCMREMSVEMVSNEVRSLT